MESELKPCPFCGSESVTVEHDYVRKNENYIYCNECDTGSGYYKTKQEAKDAWNKRVPVNIAKEFLNWLNSEAKEG